MKMLENIHATAFTRIICLSAGVVHLAGRIPSPRSHRERKEGNYDTTAQSSAYAQVMVGLVRSRARYLG